MLNGEPFYLFDTTKLQEIPMGRNQFMGESSDQQDELLNFYNEITR